VSSRTFILARSLLAIGLMVGFYALAFGIIAGLAYVSYATLASGRFGFWTAKTLFFCLAGMVTIFFSVIPRREPFHDPGPRLSPEEFPDLFAEIREIAGMAGQRMPEEIYLLPDMNAFVAERGGFLGFGRTRILGVGLPLLQALSVEELRAVLAHEFGHFHGGDTAVGPWIHKIRAAMARTIQGLQEQSAILRKPFEWYGILFLRTTLAVSRMQEFAADRLAARIAGLAPTLSGLKKIHALAPVSEAYWSREVGPAVRKGFRPALAEGFRAYLQSPHTAVAIPAILDAVLKEEKTDPYDSHPCLRDRLQALGGEASGETPGPETQRPAMDLVKGIERLEPGLFGFLLGINPGRLDPIAWEESGDKVHRPALEEFLQPFSEKLQPLRISEYPEYFAEPGKVAERLKEIGGVPEDPEAQRMFISQVLEAHLILRLCARGWTLRSRPGEPLECLPQGSDASTKGLVFGTIREDLEGKPVSREKWAARCRTWNLE
jgi:Zn-dependent protease with chaperone function